MARTRSIWIVPSLVLVTGSSWRYLHPRIQSDPDVESHLHDWVDPIIRFRATDFENWWTEQSQPRAPARGRPGRSPNVDLPELMNLIDERACPELRKTMEAEAPDDEPSYRETLFEDIWQVRYRESEVTFRAENRPNSRSARFREELIFRRENSSRATVNYRLSHQELPEQHTAEIEFRFRYGYRGLQWLPLGWCMSEITTTLARDAANQGYREGTTESE